MTHDSLPPPLLIPDWPAPAAVRAWVTTHGNSLATDPPYGRLNVAEHVGDDPQRVAAARQRLADYLGLDEIRWLEQVHGTRVVDIDTDELLPRADAWVSRTPGRACAVLTADCLPVFLANQAATEVAVVHAGWRGLAAGILPATLAAMHSRPDELLAWLGPAIGPASFEVGEEVRTAFIQTELPAFQAALQPGQPGLAALDAAFSACAAGKYLADLYQLARWQLGVLGLRRVYGGEFCTYRQADRFYSFRRDGVTGRMASIIMLAS